MSPKHTPGPWVVSEHTMHGYEVWARRNSGSMRVALCGTANFDEANARLIAAAPELLTALKRALTRCHNCDTGGICSECEIDLAAIRKAEWKAA
jgi:hypothetical protein